MADKEPKLEPEMAPDPDEDDLSDLDDMLDEFSVTKQKEAETKAPTKSVPSTQPKVSANAPPLDMNSPDEDFTKQLQAGMAELLGQFGSNPEMQNELEAMMKELSETASKEGAPAMVPPQTAGETAALPAASAPQTAAQKKATEESFQDTIRKTMERMQNSGDTASAAAASSSEEDMFAQMLKDMEGGKFPGLDGGNEEDFNKMLMGMMEQLTNKEILYEPMKDLHAKFPGWLEANRDKTKKEDLDRYEQQQTLVTEIVGRFDRHGYSDENQADRDFIVERMQKMQAAGSPPPDLIGDMGSTQEMLGDLDGGCPSQ